MFEQIGAPHLRKFRTFWIFKMLRYVEIIFFENDFVVPCVFKFFCNIYGVPRGRFGDFLKVPKMFQKVWEYVREPKLAFGNN